MSSSTSSSWDRKFFSKYTDFTTTYSYNETSYRDGIGHSQMENQLGQHHHIAHTIIKGRCEIGESIKEQQ